MNKFLIILFLFILTIFANAQRVSSNAQKVFTASSRLYMKDIIFFKAGMTYKGIKIDSMDYFEPHPFYMTDIFLPIYEIPRDTTKRDTLKPMVSIFKQRSEVQKMEDICVKLYSILIKIQKRKNDTLKLKL